MMAGPDLETEPAGRAALRGTFVYSGGISSVEDLRALAALRQVNLSGVIVGKALYERRFTVAEGQAALDGPRLMHYKRVIPCLDVDARTRRQGRRVHRPARRRRPGRAGEPLRRRWSRRAGVPRHHRHLRQAGDGRRAGPPDRRRRVHPVHDRRRDSLGGGRPGGPRCRGGQDLGQLRRAGPARADRRAGRARSAPSAWCWPSTPSITGDQPAGRRTSRGVARRRVATRSRGRARGSSAGRGRSC